MIENLVNEEIFKIDIIDNHSYKIFNVFYVMSSLFANFYDDEHFLIVYFVISLDENHFFEINTRRNNVSWCGFSIWKFTSSRVEFLW
jgi:hypothetical protein